jgi:hypothetical protein
MSNRERADKAPQGARRRAYAAAAARCIQGAPECDDLCQFCRDMVDAALDAAGLALVEERERNAKNERY